MKIAWINVACWTDDTSYNNTILVTCNVGGCKGQAGEPEVIYFGKTNRTGAEPATEQDSDKSTDTSWQRKADSWGLAFDSFRYFYFKMQGHKIQVSLLCWKFQLCTELMWNEMLSLDVNIFDTCTSTLHVMVHLKHKASSSFRPVWQ